MRADRVLRRRKRGALPALAPFGRIETSRFFRANIGRPGSTPDRGGQVRRRLSAGSSEMAVRRPPLERLSTRISSADARRTRCGGWALCTSFIARAPTRFPTAMRSSPAARSPSGGRRVIATCARHWRRSHGRGRRGRRISARWCTGWSGDGDHAARAQPAHDDRQAGGGLTATPTKSERCSGAVGATFQLSAIPDPEASIA